MLLEKLNIHEQKNITISYSLTLHKNQLQMGQWSYPAVVVSPEPQVFVIKPITWSPADSALLEMCMWGRPEDYSLTPLPDDFLLL